VRKPSRFYCENCGGEVRANAKVCPHCGRFFSDVRCPACGFTGDSKLFVYGCPSCGYGSGTAGGGDIGAGAGGGDSRGRAGDRGAGRAARGDFAAEDFEVYDLEHIDRGAQGGRRKGSPATPPSRRGRGAPPWIYWLILALLGVFFVVMALIYVRL
jgi:hypothetical protein